MLGRLVMELGGVILGLFAGGRLDQRLAVVVIGAV